MSIYQNFCREITDEHGTLKEIKLLGKKLKADKKALTKLLNCFLNVSQNQKIKKSISSTVTI